MRTSNADPVAPPGATGGVFWLSLALLWLVFGGFIALFAAPKTWRDAAAIVVLGPPLYILGEGLIEFAAVYLWTDEKDDGKSEGLATIKRLWRFALAVAGTIALIALFYLVVQWLQEKL